MKIKSNVLDLFEQQYEEYLNDPGEGIGQFSKWLLENPYIVLVSNFTDCTSVNEFDLTRKLVEDNWFYHSQPLYRDPNCRWLFPWSFGNEYDDKWGWIDINLFNLCYEEDEINDKYGYKIDDINIEYIKEHLKGVKDPYLYNYLKSFPNTYLEKIIEFNEKIEGEKDYVELMASKQEYMLTFDEIYNELKKCLKTPLNENRILLSKNWYNPKNREREYRRLKAVTYSLLSDLQKSNLELIDIEWNDLENIVAALFQNNGYEVLKKENPQSGRDILGRINIGNDYEYIAIEVKHTKRKNKYIGFNELDILIQKNIQYDTLCLATNSSFTASVINECNKMENIKRIILWDGETINDLIKVYKL